MFAIEFVPAALSVLTAVVQVSLASWRNRRTAREATDASKSCKPPQCIGGRDITVNGGTVLICLLYTSDAADE